VLHKRAYGAGCPSPSFGPWDRRWRTTNVCDAWPVRRQTYRYLPSRKASSHIHWYQIILLGDRGTCVLITSPARATQQPWSPHGANVDGKTGLECHIVASSWLGKNLFCCKSCNSIRSYNRAVFHYFSCGPKTTASTTDITPSSIDRF